MTKGHLYQFRYRFFRYTCQYSALKASWYALPPIHRTALIVAGVVTLLWAARLP